MTTYIQIAALVSIVIAALLGNLYWLVLSPHLRTRGAPELHTRAVVASGFTLIVSFSAGSYFRFSGIIPAWGSIADGQMTFAIPLCIAFGLVALTVGATVVYGMLTFLSYKGVKLNKPRTKWIAGFNLVLSSFLFWLSSIAE